MTERPLLANGPFVLLDDARAGTATLLTDCAGIIEASHPVEVEGALDRLQAAQGRDAAGFLSYEAGHSLERKLAPLARPAAAAALPLLWFGLFQQIEAVDPDALLPDPAGAWCGALEPRINRGSYDEALAAVHEHILAGDIYQANITFPAVARYAGEPLALYAALRAQARAGHGGIVFTGSHWILSFSPELFFTLRGSCITTRPMKGTAQRRSDPLADAAAGTDLAADPKQRSENLMIVDLLRNDLSRVTRPGTVKAPELFVVESYPNVHQLVSSVTGLLKPGLDAVDVIRAIYPCGSITGAPKIRAMEVIAQQEAVPRGVYCGSIGRIAADGDADFNVAIRTTVLDEANRLARLGLGSGVVADSVAEDEWAECLAKGAFVPTRRRFDLIETMRHDPNDGIADFDRHFDRMKASADCLGFVFNRHDARNELQAATFGAAAATVRLLLTRSGAMAIELRPLPPPPREPVTVAVAPLPVEPGDFRLHHKTSDRAFYRDALVGRDAFEVVFEDNAQLLTEGSFTTLFVSRGDRLLTPPLSRGVLPGVLRGRLLDEGRAVEADLRRADLAGGFFVGNAVRGLLRAVLA